MTSELELEVALRRLDAVEEAMQQVAAGPQRDLVLSLIQDLRNALTGKAIMSSQEVADLVSRIAKGWAN